jgi:metallo-beta-lactamase class B
MERKGIIPALPLMLAVLASAMGCSPPQPEASEDLLAAPTKVLYNPPYENNAVEPFKIIGNIYYVGLTNYAAFLITTPDGHILLDTMIAETVPQQRAAIEKLGFKLQDIKIILQAHAHVDHVGGLAQFKEMTGGAEVVVMAEDADVLADGGVTDFRGDGNQIWTPVRADRIIHDGEEVTLGGVTMTAHLTPGHSKGCTTWTTAVEEGGTRHDVVFFCSQRVNDRVPLIDNPKYPTLAEDFAASFDKLRTLPCDVFLASHAFMFNLEPKLAQWKENPQQNPFIDPQGCRDYVSDWEYEFRYKLQQERLAKQAK